MKLTRKIILFVLPFLLVIGGMLFASAPAQAATRVCTTATPTAQLPTLVAGDSGSCVVVAQNALNAKHASVAPLVADGSFGPATLAATKRFQAARGLTADGEIGPRTWAALRGVALPPSPYNRFRGPNTTNRVVLTFDDCPASLAAFTSVITAARADGISLVLAPTGQCLASYKARFGVDLAARARSFGQWVINHSISHPDLTKLSRAGVIAELRAPGVVTNYGRPPFGAFNATVDSAYVAVHMREYLWTVDTLDWTGKTSAAVVSYVIRNSRPGDTDLMHMQWHAFNPASILLMRNGLAARGLGVCRLHVGTTPVLLPGNIC